MVVVAGGGTATRDTTVTPQNASYYIGGKGVQTTERYWEGAAYDGQSFGGGLLVIYSKNIEVGEKGKFASAGKPINGSCWAYKPAGADPMYGPWASGGAGGGSGGGSINIFYKENAKGFTASKFELSTDQYSPKGTYNVGAIGTGEYVKLTIN